MSFVCCNDILFEGLQSRNQNVLYVSFVIPSINSKWAPHNVRKGHSTSTSLIVFLFSSVTGQEKEGPVHTISRRPDPTKVLIFTLLPTRLTAPEILMRQFSLPLVHCFVVCISDRHFARSTCWDSWSWSWHWTLRPPRPWSRIWALSVAPSLRLRGMRRPIRSSLRTWGEWRSVGG